jgi:hypothetical protein
MNFHHPWRTARLIVRKIPKNRTARPVGNRGEALDGATFERAAIAIERNAAIPATR